MDWKTVSNLCLQRCCLGAWPSLASSLEPGKGRCQRLRGRQRRCSGTVSSGGVVRTDGSCRSPWRVYTYQQYTSSILLVYSVPTVARKQVYSTCIFSSGIHSSIQQYLQTNSQSTQNCNSSLSIAHKNTTAVYVYSGAVFTMASKIH
jgi:hypothetical protein